MRFSLFASLRHSLSVPCEYHSHSVQRFLLLVWILFGLSWLGLSADLQAQRIYNLPREPLDLEEQRVYPARSALDLLLAPSGYTFLRYQRALNPRFSFMFDFNGYAPNLFFFTYWLLSGGTEAELLAELFSDLRSGLGLGIAFWPQGVLRKAYVALRSQVQLQILNVDLTSLSVRRDRVIASNNLEIGTRIGNKVASAGLFGGIGFQVPIDASSVLPKADRLSPIFVYFGFSVGLTFR